MNIREQVRTIAIHMEKTVSDKFIDGIAKACEIKSMREGKRRNQPEDVSSKHFKEGYDIFYRKGVVGDWKTTFRDKVNEAFDKWIQSHIDGNFEKIPLTEDD